MNSMGYCKAIHRSLRYVQGFLHCGPRKMWESSCLFTYSEHAFCGDYWREEGEIAGVGAAVHAEAALAAGGNVQYDKCGV